MHSDFLALARRAVCASAAYLESLSDMTVDSLEGKDIKLEADRGSEALLLEVLSESGLPVLSEEKGACGSQEGLRWIVDPIDGTYNFFRGMRELSCISVALWDGMTPVTGTVYRLGTSQIFEGSVPDGVASLNAEPVRTSDVTIPADAALLTGFPVYMDYDSRNLAEYISFAQTFKKVRMLGAAALMSSLVGTGCFDVYSEKSIKLWDVAAGIAFTRAAGGVVRMLDMGNNTYHVLLCSNAELLSNLTPVLSE
jgi:myo-inositol-1(or 4)-monophosphatase